MARAIIPPRVPRIGPLPFTQAAELLETNLAPVTDPAGADRMPLSPVWPASPRQTNTSRRYDHTAEAPLYFAAALRKPNRRVRVAGVVYTVVEALEEQFLPHVALRLAEVRAGG